MKNPYLILAALMLGACANEAPDAGLTIAVNGGKAGEPVTFTIDGDADNIVFYSGEPGHEYALRNRTSAPNALNVEFVAYTDQSTAPVNNFSVLASTDFSGVYEPEAVKSTHWTDVTDRFTLPSEVKANTPSGKADLSDLVTADGQQLYLAFSYKGLEGSRNRWVVRSINIEKVSPEGVATALADMRGAGWHNVTLAGEQAWTLPGTQLLAAGKGAESEIMAVAGPYDVRKSEPSTGVALKNIATNLSEFTHTYEKAGTYEAVFVSSSVWYNSEHNSVTPVTVIITD